MINVHHPVTDETKEHHPAVASSSGQGLLSRGNKRVSNGGTASPAKRNKIFSKLLSYWENKSDSDNPIQTNYRLHTKVRFCGKGLVRRGSEVASTKGVGRFEGR